MSRVFHDIERKIITQLQKFTKSTPEELQKQTGLSPDQIRRGIQWLRLKKLALVEESTQTAICLGKNGIDALRNGLPERRLLDLVRDGPQNITHLQSLLGSVLGPATGLCKKNGWIGTDGGKILLQKYPDAIPEEKIISAMGHDTISEVSVSAMDSYDSLVKRPDYITRNPVKSMSVSLADSAKNLDLDSDSGGAIDVEADVPATFCARRHPLKETIDEIREIFVTLGFSEITGSLSQSSFWNFDALFTPQDHPAREMQDTFFLDGPGARNVAEKSQVRRVADSHKKGWRYDWDIRQAKRMVLRTHTTCVTIRHLAQARPEEARVFSMGRVFRNEKISYKHLVEFNQVEGVMTGNNATLRNLMGIQKEFYRRIGIEKIKFWPTFFPYTEPSLQTMVYNKHLDRWVELFGMGIFRPEVTKPLGITRPVLAWGGGIERIAMLKYGLDDVRKLYGNDLDWLRSVPNARS